MPRHKRTNLDSLLAGACRRLRHLGARERRSARAYSRSGSTSGGGSGDWAIRPATWFRAARQFSTRPCAPVRGCWTRQHRALNSSRKAASRRLCRSQGRNERHQPMTVEETTLPRRGVVCATLRIRGWKSGRCRAAGRRCSTATADAATMLGPRIRRPSPHPPGAGPFFCPRGMVREFAPSASLWSLFRPFTASAFSPFWPRCPSRAGVPSFTRTVQHASVLPLSPSLRPRSRFATPRGRKPSQLRRRASFSRRSSNPAPHRERP